MEKKKYRRNGAQLPDLPNVSVTDEYIEFAGYSDAEIEAIRAKVAGGFRKENPAPTLKAYEPTQSEKEMIRAKLRGSVDMETFGFYTFIAAESIRDSQRDVLDKSFLEWMGEKYTEGRVLADSHDTRFRVGQTYAAAVVPHEKVKGEWQLEVKAYVPPTSKTISGSLAKDEIDAGIVNRVSVSFYAPAKYFPGDHVDNVWGESTWIYSRPTEESSAEVIELSLVYLGAQSGARIKAEKGGIEKNITFAITEEKANKKGMEKYKILGLGLEVEADTATIEAVKALETQANDLKTQLQKFQDREKAEKDEKVKAFVALRMKAHPTLKAETETVKAARMTVEEIAEETAILVESMKGKQINIESEEESKEKGKQTDYKSLL